MNNNLILGFFCRAGSLIPPKVVADFSIRQAQDPEPVEGHIGDMASVWKPKPTLSEDGISRRGYRTRRDPALQGQTWWTGVLIRGPRCVDPSRVNWPPSTFFWAGPEEARIP